MVRRYGRRYGTRREQWNTRTLTHTAYSQAYKTHADTFGMYDILRYTQIYKREQQRCSNRTPAIAFPPPSPPLSNTYTRTQALRPLPPGSPGRPAIFALIVRWRVQVARCRAALYELTKVGVRTPPQTPGPLARQTPLPGPSRASGAHTAPALSLPSASEDYNVEASKARQGRRHLCTHPREPCIAATTPTPSPESRSPAAACQMSCPWNLAGRRRQPRPTNSRPSGPKLPRAAVTSPPATPQQTSASAHAPARWSILCAPPAPSSNPQPAAPSTTSPFPPFCSLIPNRTAPHRSAPEPRQLSSISAGETFLLRLLLFEVYVPAQSSRSAGSLTGTSSVSAQSSSLLALTTHHSLRLTQTHTHCF
jgi:hypothetical protein